MRLQIFHSKKNEPIMLWYNDGNFICDTRERRELEVPYYFEILRYSYITQGLIPNNVRPVTLT
jgi:hypothetical protein